MDSRVLEDNFITLQKYMEASLGKEGGNGYKEPHIGKKKARNGGNNVDNITCDAQVYDLAVSKLGLQAKETS